MRADSPPPHNVSPRWDPHTLAGNDDALALTLRSVESGPSASAGQLPLPSTTVAPIPPHQKPPPSLAPSSRLESPLSPLRAGGEATTSIVRGDSTALCRRLQTEKSFADYFTIVLELADQAKRRKKDGGDKGVQGRNLAPPPSDLAGEKPSRPWQGTEGSQAGTSWQPLPPSRHLMSKGDCGSPLGGGSGGRTPSGPGFIRKGQGARTGEEEAAAGKRVVWEGGDTRGGSPSANGPSFSGRSNSDKMPGKGPSRLSSPLPLSARPGSASEVDGRRREARRGGAMHQEDIICSVGRKRSCGSLEEGPSSAHASPLGTAPTPTTTALSLSTPPLLFGAGLMPSMMYQQGYQDSGSNRGDLPLSPQERQGNGVHGADPALFVDHLPPGGTRHGSQQETFWEGDNKRPKLSPSPPFPSQPPPPCAWGYPALPFAAPPMQGSSVHHAWGAPAPHPHPHPAYGYGAIPAPPGPAWRW